MFAIAGLVLSAFCVAFAIWDPLAFQDPTDDDCRVQMSAALERPLEEFGDGVLQLLDVGPERTKLNNHVCAVVAGVAGPSDAAKALLADYRAKLAALAAAEKGTDAAAIQAARQAADAAQGAWRAAALVVETPVKTVDLTFFLNGDKGSLTAAALPVLWPQRVRIRLDAPEDVDEDAAAFWRRLLARVYLTGGTKTLDVGVSRTASVTTVPDAVFVPPTPTPETAAVSGDATQSASKPHSPSGSFKLRVFTWRALGTGVGAMACFIVSFWLFARRTTLLRDNSLTVGELRNTLDGAVAEAQASGDAQKIGSAVAAWNDAAGRFGGRRLADAAGPYSLARVQMAVWFFLAVAGFLFIAMTLGQFRNLMTETVLALVGISGITGLAAIQIAKPKADSVSEGFLLDVLTATNQEGPQLQRLQTLAWTVILGGIFLWIAFSQFRFATFDAFLLLLMGFSQLLYIGFKAQDEGATDAATKPKDEKPPE